MPDFRPCVCCVSKEAVSSWNFTRVTAGPCVGNPLWEADNARHAPVTRAEPMESTRILNWVIIPNIWKMFQTTNQMAISNCKITRGYPLVN